MSNFRYRATDQSGRIVEGTMEAAETALVVSRLQERGLIPLRIGEEAAGGGLGISLSLPSLDLGRWRRRVRRRDLLFFTQELHTLLAAGLPLDRSLATLAELSERGEMKRVVGEVLQSVQRGKSLAEALAEHRSVFPPVYVSMIRAGEIGGVLDSVLARLLDYLRLSQELRDDLLSALFYPLLLTVAMGTSVVFVFTFVLPRFAPLFAEMGQAVPLPTRMLLGLSEGLRRYWWALGGIVTAAWAGGYSYTRSPRGSFVWDQWKLRARVLGPLLRKVELARLARTLGTLLRSGVPMLQALDIARDVVGNQVIGRALADVQVGVREGAGVAGPLGRSGVIPPMALQMIAVGEETGRLDEMLIQVADYYDRDVRVQLRGLTSILEPCLILIMGAGVGFVVIAILLGIFSMNELQM